MGRPNVITAVLIRGRQESRVRERRCRNRAEVKEKRSSLMAFMMEEGTASQGM